MPIVMTKYKYDDNYFLVYNTDFFKADFSVYQLQQIAYDIEADYIIIFNGSKADFYNAQGEKISANADIKKVVLYHQTREEKFKITREIEVRFTDSYINRIANSDTAQSRIA